MELKYCFTELKEKFHWPMSTNTAAANQIRYAEKRGVIIERVAEVGKGHKNFYVIKEILYNVDKDDYWKVYPKNTHFEASKEGYIRKTDTKALVGHINKYGYVMVADESAPEGERKDYRAHRIVLETWKPIENADNYVVDHINGIKTDNRVENLRWLTQQSNAYQRDKNYALLNEKYQQLVELYGYEKLQNILDKLINKMQ